MSVERRERKRPVGRPAIGQAVKVRMPDRVRRQIAVRAAADGLSQSAFIRAAVEEKLAHDGWHGGPDVGLVGGPFEDWAETRDGVQKWPGVVS